MSASPEVPDGVELSIACDTERSNPAPPLLDLLVRETILELIL